MQIKIKKMSEKIGREIPVPEYKTPGSAGMDLRACMDEPVTLQPGEIKMIPSGIAIQIGDIHYGGFVFPRSGLASKHGINLANCVGVIDSDYTGEIFCPIQNNGGEEYTIQPGDRIAQLVVMPLVQAQLKWVDELTETQRGAGGFGSTGRN